jgi:xanthine dehydrogenase YagS FAD-binding subunit
MKNGWRVCDRRTAMRPFSYVRARDVAEAAQAVASNPHARLLAGGTNLLDLMKEDVERPTQLVDLTRVKLAEITPYQGGLSIGALATNTDTANHPLVREHYPLLTQAILAGASAQIRNMATNGGNLLQRTRCPYFYDTAMPCNKRAPGTGCGAHQGLNRMHAILGWSEQCVATYPGDMANALHALEAVVRVRDASGRERRIPIADFHRLPGEEPQRDTNLRHGEVILAIELPRSSFAKHAYYLKVRDRASYAFALVAVAVALEIDGGAIKRGRVVLGGVAHMPWRSRGAEAALAGSALSEETCRRAAEAAFKEAKPLAHNAWKVELGKRALVRALMRAGQLA